MARMLSRFIAIAIACLAVSPAFAQSSPGLSYGQVPTAGQYNQWFAAKQDLLTYKPLSQSGGTMAGKLYTAPSTVNGSGFSILPGIAPTTPANGDLWLTSTALFARIGGQTVSFANGSNYLAIANAFSEIASAGTQATARTNIGAAERGANSTISSLSGLTTPLSAPQGGTGATSLSGGLDAAFGTTQGAILYRGASAWAPLAPGTSGQVLTSGGTGANPSYQTPAAGASAAVSAPQGRLTLTSGSPVMTAPVSAATTVYYTPAGGGNLVPLWNGSSDVMTAFTQQSLSTSVLAASNVYDVFVYSSAGTATAVFGPAWTAGATAGSNTTRGSGAGSTALTRVNGLLRNAVAISGGPAAGFGTYVGTIATDSTGATVSWSTGGAASGGSAATLNVWNMYNRVTVAPWVQDSSSSHTYASSTMRGWNASAGNRIAFVRGLAEDQVLSDLRSRTLVLASNGSTTISIGLDSTTAAATQSVLGYGYVFNSQWGGTLAANFSGDPGIGVHYLQALEASDGTNTNNFYGGQYMSFTGVFRQ